MIQLMKSSDSPCPAAIASLRSARPRFRPSSTAPAAVAGFCVAILFAFPTRSQEAEAQHQVDFVKDVLPIFQAHCFRCHGETTQESNYRLDIGQLAKTGGDFGESPIIAGNGQESPLLRYVRGLPGEPLMPPADNGKPSLSAEQIEMLRVWIDEGANWPASADARLTDKSDWWSLKPITRPAVPVSSSIDSRHPIDAFIDAKLSEAGLSRSPPASRSTLIRRIYFDLIGLPPSPAEVDAFLADSAPDAWERLVDRLLASPRYGERWARHWLDLVHYGETHGYDKDRPRPNAWPFRDYIIRSFNQDKPYARFVQEQIAGDVLFPGTRDGIEALGFIAAGPWDLIGHAEVPESKIDGKIARHMDRDDMVQNTMLTFNSLTIGCAQCHDHKFDAITQEDYYRLQAVFAAVDRTEVPYYRDNAIGRKARKLKRQRSETVAAISKLKLPLQLQAGEPFVELSRRIENAAKTNKQPGNKHPAFGYHSGISKAQDSLKWVQVDLGRRRSIDRVVLLPCFDDFNSIGSGFGFPIRFKVEASDDPTFKSGVSLFRSRHDETFMADFPNPQLSPVTVKAGGTGIEGRYVRVTAVKLAPRQNDFILAIAELQVLDAAGENLASGRTVSAQDSVEAPPRWQKANLTDGIAPERTTSQESREQLTQQLDALVLSFADQATRLRLNRLQHTLQQVEQELATLPSPSLVYAGAVHTGSGNFRGTGHAGGTPRTIHVLHRGDVNQPQAEVRPGAVEVIEPSTSLFALPPHHGEGERRAALARWLTSSQQPLTWRSIVNRVWQYHFGNGLVSTSNDFGRGGALPTHPELLDWLATEFRDRGGSIKGLHRLIVTSATYQQSSAVAESAHFADAADDDATNGDQAASIRPRTEGTANLYLSHMNRRQLDAESLRDSVLQVAGRLDTKMGGPSFQDFVIEHPEHSPHYEYQLHDPDDPLTHRRSIYRFIVRSQLQPFMTALDCADPSMQVDKRNESLSPLQALTLLNNGIMVSMSKHFAARLDSLEGSLEGQITRGFREALGRPPTNDEQQTFVAFAKQYGLENTCRVLFNLNEFAFVD
jgi:cytochrome c553